MVFMAFSFVLGGSLSDPAELPRHYLSHRLIDAAVTEGTGADQRPHWLEVDRLNVCSNERPAYLDLMGRPRK